MPERLYPRLVQEEMDKIDWSSCHNSGWWMRLLLHLRLQEILIDLSQELVEKMRVMKATPPSPDISREAPGNHT